MTGLDKATINPKHAEKLKKPQDLIVSVVEPQMIQNMRRWMQENSGILILG